jgi:hypothetical protein
MTNRIVTAIAVLVSAEVHLQLWVQGFRDIAVIGPAFLVNAVAGVVIAALLVGWRHWVPGVLAFGFGASTLGAFVISATVGLFGVHEVWTGTAVLIAAASEVVAVVGGALVVLGERRRRSGAQAEQRAPVGGAYLD